MSNLSAASPDMPAGDFSALVEDIRARGQLVPIWVSGDEVIDGRKRLRACQQLGVEPKTVEVPTNGDAGAYAHALNILRTHYTTSQRAVFAAKRATRERGQTDQPGRIPKFRDSPPVGDAAPTAASAARAAGVSEASVSAARKLRRTATPEVVEAVERGHITVHAAEQIVLATPRAKQSEAVAKVLAAKNGKRRNTRAVLLGHLPKWKKIAGLAAEGCTSRQIASRLGLSEIYVRTKAREEGIAIPADVATLRTRQPESTRIIQQLVGTLDGLMMSLDLVEFSALDRAEIPQWVDSLEGGIRQLRWLCRRLKQEGT